MRRVFYGWWVVAGLCVVFVFGMSSAFFTASVFLEPIEQTLGWTKTQISFGFTIAALLGAALGPVVGLAISKVGVKKVLVFGAMVTGAALCALSVIQQLWHYYVLTMFLAAGVSCIAVVSGATCVSNWFVKKRGTAMGVTFASAGLGGMVMVFLAAQAIERWNWRGTYVLLGSLVFFLVLPVILFLIKDKPEDMGLEPDGGLSMTASDPEVATGWGLDLGDALRTSAYWLMCFLEVSYAVAFGAMTQHAIALLRSQGVAEPSQFWSLTLGVSVLARLLFGLLADRLGKKGLMVIAWLLQITGLGSALFMGNAMSVVWVFVLFYGMGQGGFGTVYPVLLGELFGTRHFSKLYGVALPFQAVGYSIGAVLFGATFDTTGSYAGAIAIVIGLTLLSLLLTLCVRRPKRGGVETSTWRG